MIKGSFGSKGVDNWQMRFTVDDTTVTPARRALDMWEPFHSANNLSGSEIWNPDTYRSPTGQACVWLYSNGSYLTRACISIFPANIVIRSVKDTSRCLDVDLNQGGRNGNRVQLWTCNGQPQQGWRLNPYGAIQSIKYPSKCLDADLNTINRDGTIVQLWDCNGQQQQQWSVTSYGAIWNGYGRALDADLNTIYRDGTTVQLWVGNGQPQQRWQ
jgi:hypothetical protein